MRDRLDAPVLVGVGAAFDFHAGLKRQAPDSLQRLGLEWAFRLVQEPRRLWRRYLRYNPRFVHRVRPPIRSAPAHAARSLAGACHAAASSRCWRALSPCWPPRPRSADVVDDEPAVAARGVGDMRAVHPRLRRRAVDPLLERHGVDELVLARRRADAPARPRSSRPDGIYDVIVRGPDNAVYHRLFHARRRLVRLASLGGASCRRRP